MESAEIRQLTQILVITGDLLSDVASAGPSIGLPAGLWQPIVESLAEMGSPRRLIAFEDAGYGLMRLDPAGVPLLLFDPEPHASIPGLERATRDFIASSAATDPGDLDFAASVHGLTGASLAMKAEIVQLGFETYVAHGRITEVRKGRPSRVRRAYSRLKDALGPCSTVLDSAAELPQMGYLKLAGEGVEMIQHAIGFARGRPDRA